MLRCTTLARVAAGAAKASSSDVPQLTRSLHQLSLAPQLTLFAPPGTPSGLNGLLFRTFATKTVKSRTAKSATSRTPRKSTTTKRKTTAKKTTAKKKAPAKKKALGRKKTPGRKTKPAAKAKPKRKVPTEKQKLAAEKTKERDTLKKLKETALVEPKGKPENAWIVYMAESTKGSQGGVAKRVKDVAIKFKALRPEELEHYNHIANQNKAANKKAYSDWLNSHTPEQIRLANLARLQLKRKLAKTPAGVTKRYSKGTTKIKDERLVPRPLSGYMKFSVERRSSGDFKNIALGESSRLITQEWRGLTGGEKKKYTDLEAADRQRYVREYQSTYGHAPSRTAAKAAAA